MRLDAIQDQLCEIAPSHNIRSPVLIDVPTTGKFDLLQFVRLSRSDLILME